MFAFWRGRAVAPARLSFCLVVLVLAAMMVAQPGTLAAASQATLPPAQPQLGLSYAGLSIGTGADCAGAYRVDGTDFCTTGPDQAPRNLDLSVSVEPLSENAVAATPSIICDGDGVSGNRLQVLYVRPQSAADRYNQYLATLRSTIADVDTIFNASAAETGGVRHLRLATDSNCAVDVARVTVSDAATTNFGQMVGELSSQGYNRVDRKYIVFMEASTYCGLSTINLTDDRPGDDNSNNFGPSYGRVDSGCWVAYPVAHEVVHMLGGVLNSAPNSTGNGHCTDAYDILCYADAPGVKLQTKCSANARQDRLDCNNDDYFNTSPPAGSYLATRWNVANSQFLLRTGPAAPAPSPSPSPTPRPSISPGPSTEPNAQPSPTPAPSTPTQSGPTLTVVLGSGGTVATSPAAPYQVGQTVKLTPMPSAGQIFLGWRIDMPGGRYPTGGVISSWSTPLSLTLTGNATVTALFAPRPAFGDVRASDPAAEAISQLASLGIIRGYGNGNFGAADYTQRAQMAALIVRAMGWGDENWGNTFADRGQISDDLWRNVGTLARYGVTQGYDGVNFGPTDEVSQLQVISFITRAMVAKGYWTPVTIDTPGLYPDVAASSGHRSDLLTFNRYAGAVPGTDPQSGYAAGGTPATRGWFAQTLRQALDSIYGR